MATNKKAKPKHLGRGLQSLLGPTAGAKKDVGVILGTGLSDHKQGAIVPLKAPNANNSNGLGDKLQEISLDLITANPYQPRRFWDEAQLEELSQSILANGVIQPIVVRAMADGFELIAGERRLRASKMAGKTTIPAIVRRARDRQLLELALVENIHRANLNAIERAKAYKQYIETFDLTQSQAAMALGENRSVVANHMRLLDLPEEIKQMIAGGRLTMGHGRAILAVESEQLRHQLANLALANKLSVREVERLVKKYAAKTGSVAKTPKIKAPHIASLEQQFTSELGTKVTIDTRKNSQRGKIMIEFYSIDDFQRIASKMGLAGSDG